MVFGIQDLQRDVQKFKQDIEIAKAKYIGDYTEYVNVATDFENVEQKDDFLQQETEALEKIFPEPTESNLDDLGLSFMFASAPFEVVSGIAYLVKRSRTKKLMKVLRGYDVAKLDDFRKLAKAGDSPKLARIMFATKNSATARLAKINKAAKISRVAGSVGLVLGIIGIAFEIASAQQRKKYLKEQKGELEKHLNDFNGYIAEANDDTRDLINAFLTYFNELEIDVDGVFNGNKDGFIEEDGTLKFEDAISQLREALNGAIKKVAELNAAVKIANRRMDRYISRGLEGAELIEEVVFDTELPEELVQRLYVFKLREFGSTVEEAIDLSGAAVILVQKLYARGYLDDGKTVEETVDISGLTEDEVRRIFASKLLDDELNAENPDDVIDVKAIAKKVGLSEEVVREIRAQLLADLQTPLDEEEDLPNAKNSNEVANVSKNVVAIPVQNRPVLK